MSNQSNGEPQTTPEVEPMENLEELNAKLNALAETLEAERKSKARILDESKDYKSKLQAIKAKEDEQLSHKAQLEEDRLKKEGQFQVLLEQRDKTIAELNSTLEDTNSRLSHKEESILNLRKASAFEREIGGKLKKDGYWNHVDFKAIALNPDTGEIDKESLRNVADNFVKEYKELVNFGANGNFPNGAPNGKQGSKLSYEQWKKLPLAERKTRMGDVIR